MTLALGTGAAFAQANSAGKIPDLGGNRFGWISGADWFDPPAGMRGPIRNDPDHKFYGNLDGPRQVTPRLGNWKDPVLKPWAAAQMKASNDEVLSGKRGVAFGAQARCYPGGVPGQLLYPVEPLWFIQQPKIVYMIWQRDHFVRRVFLDKDKHTEGLKPSWFGESIGRYEGDELVVDTIGTSAKNSYLDNFVTPHTEKMRVTERFKITNDGNRLEAFVKVDDPDTFNEPLYMVQRWRKAENPLLETVCAENNQDHFGHNLFPLPEAKTPDF